MQMERAFLLPAWAPNPVHAAPVRISGVWHLWPLWTRANLTWGSGGTVRHPDCFCRPRLVELLAVHIEKRRYFQCGKLGVVSKETCFAYLPCFRQAMKWMFALETLDVILHFNFQDESSSLRPVCISYSAFTKGAPRDLCAGGMVGAAWDFSRHAASAAKTGTLCY